MLMMPSMNAWRNCPRVVVALLDFSLAARAAARFSFSRAASMSRSWMSVPASSLE